MSSANRMRHCCWWLLKHGFIVSVAALAAGFLKKTISLGRKWGFRSVSAYMLDFASSNKPKQTATDTLSRWSHMRRSFFSRGRRPLRLEPVQLCASGACSIMDIWCFYQHNYHHFLPFLSFSLYTSGHGAFSRKGQNTPHVSPYQTIKNILHILLLLLPLWLAAPAEPHPQAWPRAAGAPCPGAGCRSGPSCIPLRSRPQTAPCPLQGSTGIWCDRRVWLRHRQTDHKVQGCYRTSNKYGVNWRPGEAAVQLL